MNTKQSIYHLVKFFIVIVAVIFCLNHETIARSAHQDLVRRSSDKHDDKHGTTTGMMHSHMSRKVFDRACAADKDTIEEIIACFTSNESLIKAVPRELAENCYKDAFNETGFDHKDFMKHKEIICAHRDKFEVMTACIYRKTTESLDSKGLEKLTDAMVDVGMCIINALD